MARVPLHNHTNADNGGPVPARQAVVAVAAAPVGVPVSAPPVNPPKPVVTCVGDSFVRANSTGGLGVSSDGDLWVDAQSGHGIAADLGFFNLASGGSYLGAATLSAVLPPLPIVGSMTLDAPVPVAVTIPNWGLTNSGRAGAPGLTLSHVGLGKTYTATIQHGATVLATYPNTTTSADSGAGDGTGLDLFSNGGSLTLNTLTTYDIWGVVTSTAGAVGYSNGLTNLNDVASDWPAGLTATQIPAGSSSAIVLGTPFKIGSFTLSLSGGGSAAPDAVTFKVTTTDSGGSGSVEVGYGLTAGNLAVTVTDSAGSTSTATVVAAGSPFPNVQSFSIDTHSVQVTFNGQTVAALYSAGSPAALLVPNAVSAFTVNANSATSAVAATALFNNLTICNYAGTPVPPPPTSSSPSSIPTNIDTTGATDVSLALSAFLNGVAPGSTVTFPPTATYLAALKLHGLSNVTLEGQGCTIQAPSGGYTEDYSTIYLKSFPGTNSGITIHGFHFIGTSPTPGTFISGHEGQHGVLVDGGSNITIYGCTSAAMFGDFVEVNSGASHVRAHDNTVTNTGRNALSVIFGNNVEFDHNSCPINGYMPFDVEPNTVSETCHDINIHDNTTGSWTNLWFATDGSATGAAIYNITVANNVSVGHSLATEVNPTGPGRESSVSFTGNSSNVSAAGPVLQFTNVDTLTVIHNTQSLSSGSLVSDTGCTNAVITPNP